jgi:hypothetical protein
MAGETVMSFAPEVGGTICNYRQAGGRQIPLRRVVVPLALIKHYVPNLLRRRAMLALVAKLLPLEGSSGQIGPSWHQRPINFSQI